MITCTQKYEAEIGGSIAVTLVQQFRMQSTIAMIISTMSYQGILKTGVTDEDRKAPLGFPWPQKGVGMSLLNIEGNESGGRSNELECKAAIIIVINILEANDGNVKGDQILILTSYSEQKGLILKEIKRSTVETNYTGRRVSEWTINQLIKLVPVATTTSYQGSERWIVVASLVFTKTIGFNAEKNRLNVLISRAKCAIIILGNLKKI